MSKKAVVLLSGGLDSATVLAGARADGYDCYCLSFSYGQKQIAEVGYAKQLAVALGAIEHRIAVIDIGAFGGSALTDESIDVPDAKKLRQRDSCDLRSRKKHSVSCLCAGLGGSA
jgi:7-cyano-7-deazaguanine synthase